MRQTTTGDGVGTFGRPDGTVTAVPGGYALHLSEAERMRYRMMAERARDEEAERWSRAGVVKAARVADVGCGPGAVLVELARIVGEDGEAIGVEPDRDARAAAREELDAAGLGWVSVVAGTGVATGLEAGRWDCIMIRHVLTHTGSAASGIVAHVATLPRPGGFVYLVDTDLEGIRSTPADAGLEEQHRRYTEFHASMGNDVRMGPRLPQLLADAGLEVVEAVGSYARIPAATLALGGPLRAAQETMLAAGALDASEVERWEEARQQFAQLPGALLWMPTFIAVGRRPQRSLPEPPP